MKKISLILFFFCALLLGSCSESDKKTQSQDLSTVIVSLDGFRWDYVDSYNTPHLEEMAKKGVSATMIPSFPASTFPNHYTLATGLTPNHHGIVHNTFWDDKLQKMYAINDDKTRFDPQFYQGEPIWVTAQQQNRKVACIYWVASDVKIKDTYPDYYLKWSNKRLSFDERIDKAIELLSQNPENRPHLIMLYMEEPDATGHKYGPSSEEIKTKTREMDKHIGYLMNRISKLPHNKQINLIVTSDHGMTDISDERVVSVSKYLDSAWYDKIAGTNPTSIYSKKEHREEIFNALKDIPHIHVWKKEDIPSHLDYSTNHRIGDILVAPELGWQFTDTPRKQQGAHGYFPEEKDMQVPFRAYGPSFKENYIHTDIVNTDIYLLLSKILEIKPALTDGKEERILEILK